MLTICAGGIRSGSQAMTNVMAEIVTSKDVGHFDKFDHRRAVDWAKANEIVVSKAHYWTPPLYPIHDIYAVVGIRDIRDVVVSLMSYQAIDFETAMKSKSYKLYVSSRLTWLAALQDHAMVFRYEDFMAHKVYAVYRIAWFMGIVLSNQEAQQIAEHSDDKFKKDFGLQRPTHKGPYINNGSTGQWKTALTPEQISIIESQHGDWLLDNGYSLNT